MSEYSELDKVILDHVYIGDFKLTDLTKSNRLMSVGFCKECDHHQPPLTAVVDGEVKQVSDMRCSVSMGFVEPNGWCYKFRQKGNNPFLDSDGKPIVH